MDDTSIIRSYRRWARSYDKVFGKVFAHGRTVCLDKLRCQSGDRILEVGVGSGISLPFYPAGTEVVGVDISPEMLEKADYRAKHYAECDARVEVMNGESMSFADNSFDKIAAMYVVSVAADPQALVREMKRVCRPGGDLFIVNHFSNPNPVVHRFERMLAPLSKLIGFRPVFELDEFLKANDLDVQNVTPVNAFGYWSLIHAKNNKAESAEAA